MSRTRLTVVICIAEIVGMASFATFPALLPTFKGLWSLSNTEAGWISSAYYLGYLAGVPLLTAWTDRRDARRIVLAFTVLGGLSSLAFAILANGFETALVLRFLGGLGLAGTYMPGLRLVADRAEGATQSRMVALYTASFSAGASLSYLLAGEIAAFGGWRLAFGLSAVGSMAAFALVATLVPAAPVAPMNVGSVISTFDVRPVLRRPATMAYVLGYAAHMWELFAVRAWIVAFLAWCFSQHPDGSAWSATRIAALVNLIGMPASVLGNEWSVKLGRRRAIASLMLLSAVLAVVVGRVSPVAPGWAVALAIVYGALVMSDSSSLTAGAVATAPPGRRGATLAVHSTVGFAAAFAGPLAVGIVLDAIADPGRGWAAAFVTMGAANLVGIAFVSGLGRYADRTRRAAVDPESS